MLSTDISCYLGVNRARVDKNVKNTVLHLDKLSCKVHSQILKKEVLKKFFFKY